MGGIKVNRVGLFIVCLLLAVVGTHMGGMDATIGVEGIS